MPRNCCPYRDAEHQRRLWNPCMLGSGVSHWNTRDGNMTISGGAVSAIKSPCGFTMSQATGSKQAAMSSFLGGPALYFDGVDDEYAFASFSTPWSMFVVNKSDEVAGDTTRFTYAGGPADYVPIGLNADANNNVWRFNGANYLGNQISVFRNGTPTELTLRDTAFDVLADGQPHVVSMLNMYTTSASGMIFGASTASSVYRMSGWWTDTVVVRGTVGDHIRHLVEGYLAWAPARYGNRTLVARLAGTHPFKNRPPLIGD